MQRFGVNPTIRYAVIVFYKNGGLLITYSNLSEKTLWDKKWKDFQSFDSYDISDILCKFISKLTFL